MFVMVFMQCFCDGEMSVMLNVISLYRNVYIYMVNYVFLESMRLIFYSVNISYI